MDEACRHSPLSWPNVFALFRIFPRKEVNLDATLLAELTNTFLVLLTYNFSFSKDCS